MSQLENLPTLNEDLGVLIGLLLTDGCITANKKGSVQIKFTSKSEELHNLFREKMKKCFGCTNLIERKVKRVHKNSTSIVKDTIFFDKSVANTLLKLTPTFRKKPFKDGTFPNVQIPQFVFTLKPEEISKVLQAMFSADGSVCLWVQWREDQKRWIINKCIELACKHPLIGKQVAQLLIQLGFQPIHRVKSGKVSLFKREDILKFKELIGFVPGVKITRNSKVWEGFEKNQILDLAIKTMELKKEDLEHFENKEEVINFLKSLLDS
jgi:CTP:phosphocholine cytidylyltransferase-like protein